MTTTRIRRAPAVAPAKPRPGDVAAVVTIAGSVTLLIRMLLHTRSFDLFGDEVIYTDLSHSVISGGFPQCCADGDFFLHGPTFFYLGAGWDRLLGTPLDLMAQVYQLRMLNALLAAATDVVLVLLATRASSLRVGAVVGLLFALDPFCIRQNDRVLLETGLMLWVMLGYLVFTPLIGRLPSRRDWPRAVGAGLLFGCAVLTKDEGALLTVLPLLASAVLRWGPRLALTLLTVATTIAVYAVYVAVVVANGQFADFWGSKTSGVQRMAGVVQASGFRRQGGGNLSSRLIAEFGSFAATYVILALALPAVVVLLLRGGQLQRMLGLLYCAGGMTLGYALVLGTLEEQELYLLIVPSLLILPIATALLLDESRRFRRGARQRRWILPTAVITVALTLALSLNLATFVQWLRQPDDGFAQLFGYMATHVPVGARVGEMSGDEVAQYALTCSYPCRYHTGYPEGYQVGLWLTPAALSTAHVGYALVEWGPVNEGYSDQTPSQVRQLVVHGRLVFSFRGPTYGKLVLYKLQRTSGSVRTRR